MEEESNNQRASEHHIQNKESTETELLTKLKKLKDKYNYLKENYKQAGAELGSTLVRFLLS